MNFIRLCLWITLFSVQYSIMPMNKTVPVKKTTSTKKKKNKTAPENAPIPTIEKPSQENPIEKLPQELKIQIIEELCKEKIKQFNRNNQLLEALKNIVDQAIYMNIPVHKDIESVKSYQIYKFGEEIFLIQSKDTKERFQRLMNINNTIKKGWNYPGISEFLEEHKHTIKNITEKIKQDESFTRLKNVLDAYSKNITASNDLVYKKALKAVQEIEKTHNDTTLNIEDFLLQLDKNYTSINECFMEFEKSSRN